MTMACDGTGTHLPFMCTFVTATLGGELTSFCGSFHAQVIYTGASAIASSARGAIWKFVDADPGRVVEHRNI